jgi:single-stranded-DNA-specific exonuclease
MVPLVGENRTLVKYGLIVLNKTRRVGLRALMMKAGLRLGSIQEDDIAFSIAPRINAASRMDDPMLAFRLLDTTDDAQAKYLSATLDKLNETRKSGVAQIMKQLYDTLEHREFGRVLVVGSSEWSPGILGLIASKLVEKYNVTVFVWGQGEGGLLKGSCRSDGQVSVMDLMSLSDTGTFEHFGGHELAGGFAVSHERIHFLEKVLCETYIRIPKLTLPSESGEGSEEHVTEIEEMNRQTYATLSKLSPHGISNQKPIFKIVGIGTVRIHRFGKSSEHAKLQVGRIDNLEIIYFYPKKITDETEITINYIIGNLEESVFMGRKTLRLRVIEMN